jgi:hypothetical protein
MFYTRTCPVHDFQTGWYHFGSVVVDSFRHVSGVGHVVLSTPNPGAGVWVCACWIPPHPSILLGSEAAAVAVGCMDMCLHEPRCTLTQSCCLGRLGGTGFLALPC